MALRCLLGHTGEGGTYNDGLLVAACAHCGRGVVAVPGGHWHQVPRGFAIVWRSRGAHAVAADQMLAIARRRAPLLHRLRRRPRREALHRIVVSLALDHAR